jgi:hypothetical protein
LIAILLSLLGAGDPVPVDADRVEFFEKRIRPLLAANCFKCHGPQKQKANLRLDHISTILAGGDTGPAISPGEPDQSLLIQAVRYDKPSLQMPPKGKLADEAILDLVTWVKMGAPWPDEEAARASAGQGTFDLAQRRHDHWAWRPIDEPTPPVMDSDWARNPVDQFLLAKLEASGLKPAAAADRGTLIRRVSFDLIGLPPTSREVEAFAGDESPDAFEKVVDRLLDSPRFGERWGRHWLDLVRYAETLGHEFDYPIHHAWRYRDYVIRALNADVSYDQFVTEHIAGDLLESPRRQPSGFNESIVGTGFFWLGQEDHSPVDVKRHEAERIDNQIDVLTKTFLGLTVACARCHDHKFDAISTKDYYALYGILASSRYAQRSIDPQDQVQAKARELAKLKQDIEKILGAPAREGSTPSPLPEEKAGQTVFVDFSREGYERWFVDGLAFGERPTRPGDFLLADADRPVALLGAGWAHSGLLSEKLEGVLRSPTFTIRQSFIHVLAAGKQSRINVVIDGFNLIRDPIYGGLKRVLGDKDSGPAWITMDVSMWQGHKAYLELSDQATADLADEPRKGGYGTDGYLAVQKVIFSGEREAPEVAVHALTEATSPPPLEGKGTQRLQSLLKQYREIERSIPRPTCVPAMADGTGIDEQVFIRGQAGKLGEKVPRRFLEALSGANQPPMGKGSGRLELAKRILDASNPFLARVMVNRVWHHLFGQGLVPSVDNLGALGERPSHPELLDWLANWCRSERWSTKRLIRLLVTSSAYRMSSHAADPVAEEKDPSNDLLHRMRVRRLEGEAIRDAVLFVTGKLDESMFGPPVPVHLTPFMDGRGRPESSGPLDGAGRRSIYLEVRRNFLPPMLLAFDSPIPASTVGKRSVSNVPAQALILLNDPFLLEEGKAWAKRVLSEDASDPAQRIGQMYLSLFSRPPSPLELSEMLQFLDRQGEEYHLPRAAQETAENVWTDLCHVMFNVTEFIFLD